MAYELVTIPVRATGQMHAAAREGTHFTYTLSAASQIEQLLGRDYERTDARVIAVDGPVILAQSKEIAEAAVQATANGVTAVPGSWLPALTERHIANCDELWAAFPSGQSVALANQASQQNTGSVGSPAANTVIAELTGLAAGIYQAQWLVSLGGTTGNPEANNFGMYIGAALTATSNNRTGAGNQYPQPDVTISVPANGTVSIQAIAAGTAASTYDAMLVLTQLTQAYASGRVSVIASRRLPEKLPARGEAEWEPSHGR